MPETPEIQRTRKANMLKNQQVMMGLGFDGGGNSSVRSIREGGLFSDGRVRNIDGSSLAATTAGGGAAAPMLAEPELLPLEPLMQQWPGREDQIRELAGLIGEVTDGVVPLPPLLVTGSPLHVLPIQWVAHFKAIHSKVTDGVPVPPLLITGPPSTGKTGVVRAVLDYRGFSYVHVNCTEAVAKRGLLEAVLEQAAGSREDVLEANRVDRSFRDNEKEANFVEEVTGQKEDPTAGEGDGDEGGEEAERQRQSGEATTWRKGKQRPACSSWNVFFRQLSSLLARRSTIAAKASEKSNRSRVKQQKQQQQQQQQHPRLLTATNTAEASSAQEAARTPSTASSLAGRTASTSIVAGSGGRRPGTIGSVTADEKSDGSGSGASGKADDENRSGIGGGSVSGGGGGVQPGTNGAYSRGGDSGGIQGGLQLGIGRQIGGYIGGMGGSRGGVIGIQGGLSGGEYVEFPRKLFVVLDNAEALLGDGAAGIGVSVGGSSTSSWRGPDLLARLARLPSMVASFTGFAGLGTVGGAVPAPICPILISQNCFFASEIMSGGADGGGIGGRSLVASACPAQIRFPPYAQKELPDVLTATAEHFGNTLTLKRSGTRHGGSYKEGRTLFRKMATALVQSLRNETSDVWELGAEAAKIWPAYRKMAEDGLEESELAAGLKPLLTETTKRLHGTLDSDTASAAQSGVGARKRKRQRSRHENLGLSSYSKHLLVAAYLASHNSREADRDLFTAKNTARKRSRMGGKVGNAENLVEAGVEDLPEAREFQLERLLSIMTSLVAVTGADTSKASATGSTELFMQLKSLTKLNLITECPGTRKVFDLDAPSYRCNVTRELAESVAQEIDLTLSQYLVAGH